MAKYKAQSEHDRCVACGNTNHRCLTPIFMFTDLWHHRTCSSCEEAALCIIGEPLTLQ